MSSDDATPTPDTTTGIDRRSALKKAAAAGAIAWTAPTILSNTAHAQTPGTCTPKCLPLGSGSGLATASATCTGNGIRRTITLNIDLSAVQTFTCPCGGQPTVTSRTCTSNVGSCNVGAGGTITVTGVGRFFTGTLLVQITLSETASCPDRSPDDGDCFATCSTTVSVSVPIQDRGNCNGFPTNLAPTVTTTCN
jgi:hypothetical protein